MPATAGRVRMPANNRVHSTAALQTHGIWQSAIGYDPYAPAANNKHQPPTSSVSANAAAAASAPSDSAYASYQNLIMIIRGTGGCISDETRGACRKCGRFGHLTFQCRNFLSVKDLDDMEGDDVEAGIRRAASSQANVQAKLDEIRKNISAGGSWNSNDGSGEEDEEDSDDDSDSDIDSAMERLIVKRERQNKNGSKQSREEEKKEKKIRSHHKRSSRGRSMHRRSSKRSVAQHDSEQEKSKDNNKKKSRRKRRERSDEDSESDGDKRKKHRKSRKDRERCRSRQRKSDELAVETSQFGREDRMRGVVAPTLAVAHPPKQRSICR